MGVVLQGRAAAELNRHLGGETDAGRAEEVFYLALKPETGAASPLPMIGRYSWRPSPGVYLFHPQAPLTRGRTYLVVFDGPRISASLPRLEQEYTVPGDRSPSPSRVTSLHPNDTSLPANLLKFYIHFSEPMTEGKLFRHVRLLDSDGKPVDQAFREVELWTEDHRRVTLWINPGRTKRQLGLSESLGPVLMPGRQYTLEVLPGLPDQQGRPLPEGVRHAFTTSSNDREQPRIEAWKLQAPSSESREPLAVAFPEPMDHALAGRVIRVEGAGGRTLEGETAVSTDGRRWTFTPAAPWSSGSHTLVAAGELEDLAGNSLYRAFETDNPEERPVTEPPLFRRAFSVR